MYVLITVLQLNFEGNCNCNSWFFGITDRVLIPVVQYTV